MQILSKLLKFAYLVRLPSEYLQVNVTQLSILISLRAEIDSHWNI